MECYSSINKIKTMKCAGKLVELESNNSSEKPNTPPKITILCFLLYVNFISEILVMCASFQ